MNVWREKSRGWRKGKKRAVSPIIATILLVAITVVLAAVLYVLISGLTRGPGNTPIGSAFGMASPTFEHPAAAAPGCAANDYCYTVAIASAGGGITWSSVNFVLHTSSGNPVTPAGFVGISIIGPTGFKVGAGCVLGNTCTSSGNITTTQTIVVDFGTTTPSGGGYILVANGVGSYSSSTSTSLP